MSHPVSMIAALSLFIVCHAAVADMWDDADWAVRRLDPAAFRELPAAIVTDLKQRGCTIPQAAELKDPHNVIRGEFAKRGQQDWAVLCSRNQSSSVLIFWANKTSCPSEIMPSKDRSSLQTLVGGIGYSRIIRAVGEDFIIASFKEFGGPTPPPITHQGVEDAFMGKASSIHYCNNGEWVRLQGAD